LSSNAEVDSFGVLLCVVLALVVKLAYRHAGFALQPHGPVGSRDHMAGTALDGVMLGLVACS
jgi:hypothetical protein